MLLALLLMAAITASTIGISLVISTTARQSKNLDNFIIASLGADSGLERSLAVVSVGRKSASLATAVSTAAIGATDLGNNASFGVTATDSATPLSVPKLDSNQSFTFDLLKTVAGEPPSTVIISGVAPASGPIGTLDVSWVLIDGNGNTNITGRDFISSIDYTSGATFDLKNVVTENTSTPSPYTGSTTFLGYRVSVRARSGSVLNVTVNSPIALPSSVSITSTGTAGATRSVKTASILWQLPTSKLFNYVLFTEGPIISCGSLETSC